MARTSDTRALIRECADRLSRKGITPTFSLVRKEVKRGSASTLVDELKRWNEARASVESEGRKPEFLSPTPIPEMASPPMALAPANDLVVELRSLRERLDQLQREYADALDIAYERYKSVQHHALQQIEAAREQTRYWREEVSRIKRDANVRADAYRFAMRNAQEEASRLREQLERAGLPAAPSTRTTNPILPVEDDSPSREVFTPQMTPPIRPRQPPLFKAETHESIYEDGDE